MMGRPQPDNALAQRLFAELRARTGRGNGIVRDSYGPGEEAAHELVRRAAEVLDLEIVRDAAANLYMTLPGRDRTAAALLIGSHLDSVPQGGNYDGAAGVLAGLSAVAGLREAAAQPAFDITVMAIRAEEAAWFNASYIGSSAAWGQLSVELLDTARRSDTGRSLAEHMTACGADVLALRRREAFLSRERVRAYLEVHIEQGPVLEGAGIPLGLVTGIRGCRRFRDAHCYGAYAHSGAEPHTYRRDAVIATVSLIRYLHDEWRRVEAQGGDLTFTVGELGTDPALHGPSKVAGETRFVLDFRSLSDCTMIDMCNRTQMAAKRIEACHRVRFQLGPLLVSAPAILDVGIRQRLAEAAAARGIPTMELPSGAGHDAAVFANLGVPSALLFIRNAHGSHTPEEAMEMADFTTATTVLLDYLVVEAELV
jgi:N-carbamoyl-L-amino-acid hydrolase